MKIETCACYIRVSTDEQKQHGLSLDAQRDKLKTYAQSHGLKIYDWYEDEGVSGTKLIKNRPELQRMVNDAKKGLFSRIIFIRLDRFFRSVGQYHECMKLIGSIPWTATEEDKYDLSTASGRAFVNMKLTIAEYEAGNTGEKIKDVNQYKVKTGQPLTGSMPLCYRIIQTDKGKRIARNPETEELTLDFLNHLMTHQSKSNSVKYINRKYGTTYTYQQLDRLIKNPLLYGEYRGNPNYIAEEERYMTKVEFDKLQSCLKRQVKSNNKKDYIFSGLIKCPHCGSLLKSSMHPQKRKDGTRVVYLKYRCSRHNIDAACTFNKVVAEKTFEKMMLEEIEKFFENEKIVNTEIMEANNAPDIDSELKDLQEELDRLNYAWQKGRLKDFNKYDSEYEKIVAEMDALKFKKVEVEKRDFSKIEDALASGWKDMYNTLDRSHKRAFWRSFVESVEIEWTTKLKRITKINFF